MKLHRNSLLTAAAIVLVLYLVSLVAGLPAWAAVVLIVVLLVLLAVVWKQPEEPRPVVTRPAPAPSVVLPDPDPVFSGPPSRTVADVRLPSATPDFQFSFSAVVQWSTVLSGSRHADLGALAVDALLDRARSLTSRQQVTEESLNQHRLAALLGEPALDEKGQVRSWATEVRLRLPDADQKHLQHLAALHRREQTALLERRMEQDKRTYLKDDVFATPGSAAVWWLVNHPGEVETALGLLDTLSELSAAANDLPVRRTTAEEIERQRPTRAELAFSTEIEELNVTAQTTPDATVATANVSASNVAAAKGTGSTAASQQRPVPRHAGTDQQNGGHDSGPARSELTGPGPDQAKNAKYREQFFTE
ncbi:hypothetical protein [Kribbella sp. NPDC048928]|uniref:hypothetical protein n=1 Tax=Kribbella sp. NPDC048928 TaxID=3364111 RepID=UPI00371D67F1